MAGEDGVEPGPLPDGVVVAMLQREALLTRAKLHGLSHDQRLAERRLRPLKTQLRQARPSKPPAPPPFCCHLMHRKGRGRGRPLGSPPVMTQLCQARLLV